LIDEAEDRGVRSDAERQRRDCNECHQSALPNRTQSVFEVHRPIEPRAVKKVTVFVPDYTMSASGLIRIFKNGKYPYRCCHASPPRSTTVKKWRNLPRDGLIYSTSAHR